MFEHRNLNIWKSIYSMQVKHFSNGHHSWRNLEIEIKPKGERGLFICDFTIDLYKMKFCILLYTQKQRWNSIFQVSMVCVNVFFVYFKNHGWKNYLRGGKTTRVYLPSKRSSTPFKKFHHGILCNTPLKSPSDILESLVLDS